MSSEIKKFEERDDVDVIRTGNMIGFQHGDDEFVFLPANTVREVLVIDADDDGDFTVKVTAGEGEDREMYRRYTKTMTDAKRIARNIARYIADATSTHDLAHLLKQNVDVMRKATENSFIMLGDQ